MWQADERRVLEVAAMDLRVEPRRWTWAEARGGEIEAHWTRRRETHPNFFNGPVHLLTSFTLSPDGTFSGRFLRTEFKSFLYWRERGFEDGTVMDAFGSALIFSADGRLLFGQQRSGNLNGGLFYPPSGFIDVRDIGPDGVIDIEASVAREIGEEVGLDANALGRRRGYVLTFDGPVLSIGVSFDARMSESALLAAVDGHIAADPDPELARAILLAPGAAPADLGMPGYARTLIERFPARKSCL